jgi:acylphosphatase
MKLARRFLVRGRVQGVGFRYFVQHTASGLGVDGWVRNLDDGTVEVYAVGTQADMDALCGALHKGPRFSDVRGVEQNEEPLLQYRGFQIRH